MVAAAGVTAGVGAAAGIGSALLGSSAASKASKAQIKLAQQALAQQQAQYDQTRKDSLPFLTQGQNAVGTLGDYLGTSGNTSAANYGQGLKQFTQQDFVEDPGYQFSLQQGQEALERSQAAKNGLLSGAALKAASDYGQGMAAQQYDTVYNRYKNNQTDTYNKLAGLSGIGQGSASQLATSGQANSTAITNILGSEAQAQTAGIVGQANAWQTGLGSLSSAANTLNSGFTLNAIKNNPQLLAALR